MSAADRAYRAVLSLYPRTFRDRFGHEMIDFFHARRLAAYQRGGFSKALFWLATIADVTRSLWREHAPDAALPFRPRVFAGRLGADLRDASRFLRRSPGMTAAIVLLMTLTIGAASSVFSVVNAVMIRPLPFPDPERLVMIWETRPRGNVDRIVVSGHEFPVWEEQSRAFARMAAIAYAGNITLTGAGDPKTLFGVRVTAGFFEVMGVAPALGRTFVAQDDVPGGGQVVVLSDGLWRERFGADPNVVGRRILLDDRPLEVVGIMPAAFNFPQSPLVDRVDFWAPIAEPIRFYRGRHYLNVVARLAPEVSLEQAQGDIQRVARDLTKQFPQLNDGHEARVVPLQTDLARDSRASLLLLLGAVLCLLLIGCSNIAGLLLARGLARRQEIGVRLAVGGTRIGVARQLLAESVILSSCGGALGIVLTFWIANAMPAIVPRDVLMLERVVVDRTVLAFALAAAVGTGLLFGLAPALQTRRINLATGLQQSGRNLLTIGHPRLRKWLVAAQVALAVVLALGAGVTLRGLIALQRVDLGYATSDLLTVELALPSAKYQGAARQRQFFDDLTGRIAALPGVAASAVTSIVPLGGRFSGISVDVEGHTAQPNEDRSARYRIVSADYFRTMGIPVQDGRAFAASDARIAVPLIRWFPQQPEPDGFRAPQPQPIAMINATMARRFWPATNPVGRRFRLLFSPWITVVGVAADTRNDSPGEPPRPEIYLHDLQEPQPMMTLVIRTTSAPVALAPAVRSTIWDLDKNLAIASLRPMDDIAKRALELPRVTSSLVGAFALLAVGLMLAGVYGLIAFTTAQRLPELGLRVALGAERRQVVAMIARQGLVPAIAGIAAGLGGAVALTRLIQKEIFGIPTLDPFTWIAVTVVVLVAISAACWWPARRASRVDPIVVLRHQ
jgi:putative ABC transport system permease protein